MSPTIHDFLLTHLNIHVTGPSFPHREAPMQCYMPIRRDLNHPNPCPPQSTQPSHLQHSPYSNSLATNNSLHLSRPLVPGASARHIPSAEAKTGHAVVYDKDASCIWKFGSTMQAYEVFFWEKALEAAVGQEVLGVAIEGWLDTLGDGVVGE